MVKHSARALIRECAGLASAVVGVVERTLYEGSHIASPRFRITMRRVSTKDESEA